MRLGRDGTEVLALRSDEAHAVALVFEPVTTAVSQALPAIILAVIFRCRRGYPDDNLGNYNIVGPSPVVCTIVLELEFSNDVVRTGRQRRGAEVDRPRPAFTAESWVFNAA